MVAEGRCEYSDSFEYKFNLLNDINIDMREELFRCLELEENASFDDFAKNMAGWRKKKFWEITYSLYYYKTAGSYSLAVLYI